MKDAARRSDMAGYQAQSLQFHGQVNLFFRYTLVSDYIFFASFDSIWYFFYVVLQNHNWELLPQSL